MSENEYPLKTTFDISGTLTETLWFPVDKQTKKSSENNLIFFMIPGNPGVIDYYTDFLTTIYEENDKLINVIGVSHLGHSHDPHNQTAETLYSLQDQIEHKIMCFDKLREKFEKEEDMKPKFILAGHSVGGHICKEVWCFYLIRDIRLRNLDCGTNIPNSIIVKSSNRPIDYEMKMFKVFADLHILKARPNHGIERVYALFPTLQHILKTPNGAMLSPLLFGEFQRNISASFIQLIRTSLFPSFFKSLIRLCTAQSDPYLSITTDKLLHGHIVKNALYMASSEMESITELEEEFYRNNLNKFVFYFSGGDRWAPLSHYEDMVQRYPEGKVLLCDQGIPHSFVLGYGEIMGKKVSNWIKDMKDN
ncbi:976_t:CDS:2 [Cetraspora pellucida]|uniref:976_t:CDS:1 n=1 Tax=Cetraspora pellucida TaxID=1433469 RepID=A0ACA9L7L9_9GLOM|nr:976_t:CDS:2 [Cetraspora pellucida]